MVAGEELPLPAAAAAAMPRGIRGGGAAAAAGSSRAGASGVGEGKVESLADILARADDGPGNLKETFRMVSFRICRDDSDTCIDILARVGGWRSWKPQGGFQGGWASPVPVSRY